MRARSGKKKSKLESWIRSAATPFFLVAANRRVLFFNTGCEQLTGWPADEVLGELCEFHSDAEPESRHSITTALCPPPDAFAGHEQSVPVYVPTKQGVPAARLVRFIPIKDATDRVTSVLGIIAPLPPPPAAQPQPLALRYHAELSALRWSLRQRFGLKTVIARGPIMQRVFEQIRLAQKTDLPVHLFGPAGSGKEHLARAIHQTDETQQGSFVPFDCRESPFALTQLLQRLLHPDEADSPIGSSSPRTIYLNEVTQLPRDLQERFLAEFRRPADNRSRRRPLPRVISSSSEQLQDAVADERLLSEFVCWLTPLIIEVPPLHDRMEDLEPLAQAFLESLNRGSERQVSGFVADVWPLLREYQWPGNLDELALVVQEARENSAGSVITIKDLPLRFRAGLDAQSVGPPARSVGDDAIPQLEAHLTQIEREVITRALTQAKQNKTLAAKRLGIPRPVLYRRMQALGLLDREAPKDNDSSDRA